MVWSQIYNPLGNAWLSTLVAAVPIVVLLGALGIFRIKAAPMRRIRSGCCARAASGHAAAPPRSAMKLRRLMQIARWARAYQGWCCASQQKLAAR